MTQFRPTLDVRDEVENVKFKLRSACNHLKKQFFIHRDSEKITTK